MCVNNPLLSLQTLEFILKPFSGVLDRADMHSRGRDYGSRLQPNLHAFIAIYATWPIHAWSVFLRILNHEDKDLHGPMGLDPHWSCTQGEQLSYLLLSMAAPNPHQSCSRGGGGRESLGAGLRGAYQAAVEWESQRIVLCGYKGLGHSPTHFPCPHECDFNAS